MSDHAGECSVVELGRLDYREANELQERVRDAREAGQIGDTLLLLEHNPVYTRGRRSSPEELPHEPAWYAEQGIEVVDVDRGGRVTYHAPGQLVGYPIVKTADVVAHVRSLERVIIAALASVGVAARARVDEGADFTGVWVQERKIASIGVHLRRSITTHGFAINLDMDLEPWQWIVPAACRPKSPRSPLRAALRSKPTHSQLRSADSGRQSSAARQQRSAASGCSRSSRRPTHR